MKTKTNLFTGDETSQYIYIMKKTFCFYIATLVFANLAAQKPDFLENVYHYIENPSIFEINQVPGHTPMVSFSTVEDALVNDWNRSVYYQSLNGNWKFHLSEIPEKSPGEFFLPGFNDRSWDIIPVPSNWQMHGFGHPKFRNIAHPFPEAPPNVSREYNPVGSYRKTFTIPSGWDGRQIYLRFEGISSASMVWVNGKEVGYNQGAFEPSEYDITAFIQKGDNLLAVNVYQWSDGTYLEDQDFWRLSGIFRDAYLYSMPNVHIRDYYIVTDLDNSYTDANLVLEADVKNNSGVNVSGYRVLATLYDKEHKQITQFQSGNITIPARGEKNVKLSQLVKNPAKWSAEKPNLYYLTLELLKGKQTSLILSSRVGFRKVEVRDQALLLNGVPIQLNGVNSHIQHPESGRAMDTATIRKDFTLMKQFNINCVRTSHYPPNIEYLQLADEYGIYVIDETGCEAHATEYLADREEWKQMYIDRARKMVLRDRNYPSIIMWSAGNESGWGDNICALIEEGKRLDPSRPAWMYGGNRDNNPATNPIQCEDIVGPRYGTPFELKTLFGQISADEDPRPSFMDEYLAATGNALGGLDEYWEVIYRYPRLSGGAIWDFVSPGITEPVRLLTDHSPVKVNAAIMGRAMIENGYIDLSGHDEWVEIYRHPSLDITNDKLSLSMKIFPGKWNGTGTFLNKGSYQFGLQQISPDSLEFYITTKQRVSLRTALPANWVNNWHHIAGIYDGDYMKIYINGDLSASLACNGRISNFPFPVNIGRNAEIHGQEHAGYLVNARIDDVAVFDKVIEIGKLVKKDTGLISQSLLWLDFESERNAGEFFSIGIGGRTYGTIWPDRVPQPEMWQIKKSAQPASAEWIDADKGIIQLTNRFHFTNLNELDGYWKLLGDDQVLQEGKFSPDLPPLSNMTLNIPLVKPSLKPGTEYRLELGFLLRESTIWAEKGFEIAWEQLELPWRIESPPRISSSLTAPGVIKEEDDMLVSGKDFVYRFSHEKGRMVSMKFKGKEYLNDGPVPNLWRASLANELDSWTRNKNRDLNFTPGMGNDVANAWRSARLDQLKWKTGEMNYQVTYDQKVRIEIEVYAFGSSFGSGFDNRFVYMIDGEGLIEMEHRITPYGLLPAWIPRTGIQFILPAGFNQITWYGRGPHENYPDRKTGAKIGVYNTTVEKEYQPYLIPQDHGLKTDNRWVQFRDQDGSGIEFSGSELFNYSAQIYETDNLTRALYPFQLTPFDGITLNYDYATSGVGCTAISVLHQYRVKPQEFITVIQIKPF